MPQSANSRNEKLIIILSMSLVLGMAVALGLVFLWRSNPAAIGPAASMHAAIAVCPPFLLVRVVEGVADSTLAIVLTAGTIVFANGSLYAGLAAFVYWGLSTFRPHR